MASQGSAPTQIGRFRVDAVLGSGGMGSVYKAFDPTLQRTVAVKTVRPDIERPEYLERLTREAQACARLRHQNVVTVYEAGEIDGLVYIVMEYLQGTDLGVALRRGDLTFESKIRIVMQILDALEHTHRESVIHRDIKPSNVHVQPDGSIKVVDFGLARMAEISPLTKSGDVMATPDYASPEQLKGEGVDHRTDIYSTGALAYELFAGRRPFRTDSDTDSVGALILRVMSAPAPPMDVMWARKFPEIERIVARAMAKNPRDRYQTAEDMRNALAVFLASSREAIAATQAEVTARDRRTVIEARTMIANGMPAQAETLLAETLQSNPDAGDVRKMLDAARLANGTVETATAPPLAPVPPTRPSLASTEPAPFVEGPASEAAPVPARTSTRTWILGAVAAAAVVIVALVLRSESSPSPAGPPPTPAASSAPSAPPPAGSTSAAPSNDASTLDPKPVTSPVATAAAPASSGPSPAAATMTAPHEASAKELFAAKPDTTGGGVNAGLRYRLIRLADGQQTEVDPATTTFHSGDRIRFAFDSNIDGFLYVVQQGSSGRWTVLFPGSKINGGRNAIKRAEQYDVPNAEWFRFDNTAGTEQVFIFLSRDPMEQLPGFDRPVTRTETVAASVVEDLQHRVRPRDLVFEKDGEGSEGSGQSQATYVVNRAELGQAVAASITLNHQ
jgi:predicted Ser/Thr protein kinase